MAKVEDRAFIDAMMRPMPGREWFRQADREFREAWDRETNERLARQFFRPVATDAEMAAWYEQNGWRF